MRIYNKKKFICFLLVIMLLLSGMYYEDIQTDLLSMNSKQEKTASTWNRMEKKVLSPEVRAEEILSQNVNIVSVKSAGSTRQKIGTAILFSNIFEKKHERFFRYSYLEKNSRIYSNEIIVGYMHRKDGKKGSTYIF